MNFIYSGSSKAAMEAAFVSHGIFIAQKNCTKETFKIAFGTTASQVPFGETLTTALTNLERAGLLKNNFNSNQEQKRLIKAFRRVVLCHLINNSYFGFSDTLNIIFSLTGNPNFSEDYGSFLTEPHLATLAALSNNIPNILAIGYSKIIRKNLSSDIRNDIINEVRDTFTYFKESNTSSERLLSSFDRFSNSLLNMTDYNSVYKN